MALLTLTCTPALSDVVFNDIAAEKSAGINYGRVASSIDSLLIIYKQDLVTVMDMGDMPTRAHGAPGTALFDYDGDGDLDIYVSNGPKAANSLFTNQLSDSGKLRFIDKGEFSGTAATDQDSTGVCFGDIDNDGDQDLYVLGRSEPNRLFENQGDGRFKNISKTSQTNTHSRSSTACAMGDVNGNGLLDIVVANAFDYTNRHAMVKVAFDLNEHSVLLLNQGGNIFKDVSETSGLQTLAGLPDYGKGGATISWAVALLDYDLDGDADIIFGDEQGFFSPASMGGLDRGYIRIFNNNGKGQFKDVTIEAGTNKYGSWMGIAFGDLNCDGHIDIFGANVGDHILSNMTTFFQPGVLLSRWFLGSADGTFTDPGIGKLVSTPFGYGAGIADYDNDGDPDIIFHGGLDTGLYKDSSNPGTILKNDNCSANFSLDEVALANSTNHARRNVQGMALGDVNNDGFIDIISVSNFDVPEFIKVEQYPAKTGSPFDKYAKFVPIFYPVDGSKKFADKTGEFEWTGYRFDNGSLSVETSSADNGNAWIKVKTLGTVGLLEKGKVNRDGIGAVIFFTPEKGKLRVQPVLGGASHASQDELEQNFGMARFNTATIEILWPGGTRNRLYDVKKSERILFPEIPCGFNLSWSTQKDYEACVADSINKLVESGRLKKNVAERFHKSALRAFKEASD